VNNLETEIEMKEGLENDLIEDEDACDDVKNDSKSSRVYLTQPSDDLNRYMVDKFHPPTAKSKKVPYESIDLSVYQPSAKCLGFTTSECRLLHWITTFVQRYHSPGVGTPRVKGVGMLVVSLRGVNFGFWSHLGFSGQNAIIFSHEGLV